MRSIGIEVYGEWNDNELKYLSENKDKMPIDVIAKNLNKETYQVKNQAVKISRIIRKWNIKEICDIKSTYKEQGAATLAKKYNVTVNAITQVYHKL